MLTVGQHRQWLAPREWQRSSPWQSRHSSAHTCIMHLNSPQNRHCLSSLSAISAFSSELMRRHTAMCVRNTVAYSGGGCHAKLAQGNATEVYIVKRGDWLSDVAAARNMDVYDLKELNPKLDLDNIYVGQEIIVPVMKPAELPPPPPPPPGLAPSPSALLAVNDTPPTQARDKAGGNLLGNLFGRQEANAVEPALSGNVEAEVSADPEDDFKLEVYTMKRGEWVSSVASRFGVSLDELRAANPNVNLDNVRPKQTILIPRPTHLPDPVKSLAQPDICAPPSSTSQPPSLTPQQVAAKPPPSDNRTAADMCVPPSPKQGTGLLEGKKQQVQKQQQQQPKKGGGSNSKNESDMCCPPAAPASHQSMSGTASPSTEVYVVKRGDWMSTVAADRGLSLDELRQLNPGVNLDRVRTGQEILVPRTEATAAAAALLPAVPDENIATEYMIQPGDYVDTIAQQHGVSIDDIVELNSLSYEEPIQVGQTIFIPKPRPPEFELTTSTLAAVELGPPPVPPLVVGGLVGVGTALLTIAAIGFALTERSPTAAPMGGGSSGGGGAAAPPGPAGSGQVRGRPVVVGAEGGGAGGGGSGGAAEPPAAAAAAPVPRQESREVRPVKLGSSPNGNSSNGSGLANGNGAVRSQSGAGGVPGRGGSKVFRGSEATSAGLPPEVERATLAAVEAVRGGAQGLGALRVGDGYARAESLTGALQEAVRAAVVSLGSAQPTVAVAAISGGGGDADAGSYSRTEEAVLYLKKILPRDCTLHGVNAGGGDASFSRDEGSQAWAAVLLLSAPDVIVSSSIGLGYGGARLASQQAIESLASKVSGKKQLKSVVVNASPGLGPTAVEEVSSMLPGVPAYNVSAGRGMATSEWQVVAGPTASTVSPGISAIGLTTDAEFGGAFLATVTAQWLYGPRSVVAARPPTVAISRS